MLIMWNYHHSNNTRVWLIIFSMTLLCSSLLYSIYFIYFFLEFFSEASSNQWNYFQYIAFLYYLGLCFLPSVLADDHVFLFRFGFSLLECGPSRISFFSAVGVHSLMSTTWTLLAFFHITAESFIYKTSVYKCKVANI